MQNIFITSNLELGFRHLLKMIPKSCSSNSQVILIYTPNLILDLARELEELHERLEEAGGVTAAQVSISLCTCCVNCS